MEAIHQFLLDLNRIILGLMPLVLIVAAAIGIFKFTKRKRD